MNQVISRIGRAALLATVLMVMGCGEKAWVMIPPRVDLSEFEKVGIVVFSGSDAPLQAVATQQFQQAIHEAQPGVSIVVLGRERELLASVGHERLDTESIRSIAALHDLDAVFVGDLEVSRATPTLDVTTSLIGVRGSADVEATLTAWLVAADGGATVWTASRRDSVSIAHANFNSEGRGTFGVANADGRSRELVEALASRVVADYRARYVKRKLEDVPPHYVATYPNGVKTYAPPTALSHVDG